jgi:hypothetical protein
MSTKKTIKRPKVSDPLPRAVTAVISGRVIKEKDLRPDPTSPKTSKTNAAVSVPVPIGVPPPWAAFKPKMTDEHIHQRVERRIALNRKRDD